MLFIFLFANLGVAEILSLLLHFSCFVMLHWLKNWKKF